MGIKPGMGGIDMGGIPGIPGIIPGIVPGIAAGGAASTEEETWGGASEGAVVVVGGALGAEVGGASPEAPLMMTLFES